MSYRASSLTPLFGSTPLFGLRREIDRMFDDALNAPGTARWTPAVDIRENQHAISLDFELPGLKPEDVELSVENGVLTVSGQKRAMRKEGEEGRWHMVERTYGSFFRSFQLPKGVDESKIEANFDSGVLTVSIPKAALPQPRRIEIAATETGPVKGAAPREPLAGTRPSKEKIAASEKVAASGPERRG
jgi:HSP20 family protein